MANKKKAYVFILLLLQFIFTTVIYYRISQSFPKDSDNAIIVLEAKDIVNGNGLLSGWFLPGDNFYTLDTVLYVAFLKLGIPQKVILDLIPAVIFSLFGIIVLYLSLQYTGDYLLSLLLYLSFIGLSSGRFLRILLYSPSHILSLALSLVILYCFQPEKNCMNKKEVIFLSIFTMLINSGDPLTLFLVNYPLIIFSIYSIGRHKRIGKQTQPYIMLMLLMIGSMLISKLLLKIIEISGGFKTLPIDHKFGNVKYVLKSVVLYIISLLDTLNVHVYIKLNVSHYNVLVYTPATLRLLFSLVRIVFISYIFYNLIANLKSRDIKGNASFSLLPLSMISFIILTFAFILSASPKNIFGARFFVIFPVSILIALSLIRPAEKQRIKIPLLVFNLIFMFDTAFYFFAPTWKYRNEKELIRFLKDKHLSTGVAPYWDSHILTVLSDGKIRVRSVKACGKQRIKPDDFLANSTWYETEQFNFALCNNANDNCDDLYKRFINTLRKPDKADTIHNYLVLIYKKHPFRLNGRINCD